MHLQNIRPEKLILGWKSVENNHHFPPLKLSGFGLAKKLPGTMKKKLISKGEVLFSKVIVRVAITLEFD